jgi:hypothetical protein
VLRSQCLDRRIDDPKRLIGEIAAPRQNGPRLSRHAQRVIITVPRY